MDPIKILNELIGFAKSEHGQEIKGVVRSFITKNPKLVKPGTDGAPPKRSDQEIDDDIDGMIDRGEL